MNRRNFLKTIGLTLGAACLGKVSGEQKEISKRIYWSDGSYSYFTPSEEKEFARVFGKRRRK